MVHGFKGFHGLLAPLLPKAKVKLHKLENKAVRKQEGLAKQIPQWPTSSNFPTRPLLLIAHLIKNLPMDWSIYELDNLFIPLLGGHVFNIWALLEEMSHPNHNNISVKKVLKDNIWMGRLSKEDCPPQSECILINQFLWWYWFCYPLKQTKIIIIIGYGQSW